MNKKVIYLGDTSLDRQASYLAGVMCHYNIDFDYFPSSHPFSELFFEHEYDVLILSDYPAKNFDRLHFEEIETRVKKGMGLVMIGGWESFCGQGGEYQNTVLADVLPVKIYNSDDRINAANTFLVAPESSHEIIDSLPFDKGMPCVGGLNGVLVKNGSQLVLSACEYKAIMQEQEIHFNLQTKHPLLVTGNYHKGKTLAYMSDVAPHWVGGFVDWGTQRIVARASGGEEVEFGNYYSLFFNNIICWASGDLTLAG